MEHAIECNNHPNNNAVRLCDSCDMPFCAECLRMNMLGFYYCQNCYPALFKNTSAPKYEIPIDEIELNIKGETTSVTKRITIVVVASILGIVTNYYLIFTEPIARLNTSGMKSGMNEFDIGARMLLFIAFSAFEGWMVGDFATGKLFSKVKYRLGLSLVVLIGILLGVFIALLNFPVSYAWLNESSGMWAIIMGILAIIGIVLFSNVRSHSELSFVVLIGILIGVLIGILLGRLSGLSQNGVYGKLLLIMAILAIIGIVLFSNVRSRSRLSVVVSGILTGVLFWVVGGYGYILVPDFMEPARVFTLITIGGVIAPIAYILLFTSNNRHTRAIGGTVFGSLIPIYGGLLYLSAADYSKIYTGEGVPVQELFQMAVIPLMGAPLGAILGGIIGYLGIRGLYLLKYNAPLAFIGICALAGSVIGFVVSPLIAPDFYIFRFSTYYSSSAYTLWHFTAAGAFMVMAVWAGVGALAGIMSIRLDHN